MGYWKAKSDNRFIQSFGNNVTQFLTMQADLEQAAGSDNFMAFGGRPPEHRLQERQQQIQECQSLRTQITMEVERAKRIADKLGMPTIVTSWPAPAIGGPVMRINVFDALLVDYSYRNVTEQMIIDALNKTLAATIEAVQIERRHLWNPFYWLLEVFKFIIRIPFMLIQLSGFNVDKVEDHFISKAFKLAELAGIFYLLYRLGMTNEQFRELITKLLGK
jgi:hypothetical protein